MTIELGVRARLRAPVRGNGPPTTVVLALIARKAMRSGVLWGYVFGVAVASSVISYTRIYKTVAQRMALAATYGSNRAVSALFGPAPDLQTIRGFTVFKISMTLMVLGAVWGLLLSTRLLRGEEDAGRWDLVLCGQTSRRRATAQALGGFGAGLVALFALTAAITVVVGLASSAKIGAGASLYFAIALVASAAMFLAVGAVTSQLAPTRRRAASFAAVALGLSYGVRFVADAGVGLHGLLWASPLGWVEELRPLTSPQPLALVPIVAFVGLLGALAVHLAGARDVGEGIVADRSHAAARLGLLFGPTGLALRLLRGTVVAWWVAVGLSAFVYGLVVVSAGATMSGALKGIFAKLGVAGTGAAAMLGVCFLIEAILLAFVAVGQVTALRAEEAEGTLDRLMTQPVSRAAWLGGRGVVALAVLVVAGALAGLFAWLGSATQHAGLDATTMFAAGLNLVPPAVVITGVGILTFGVRPRATATVLYAVLAWSALVVVVGGFGTVPGWVLDTSVLHHMSSAPSVAPDWTANGVMTGLGLALALVGGVAFSRRDLQGG